MPATENLSQTCALSSLRSPLFSPSLLSFYCFTAFSRVYFYILVFFVATLLHDFLSLLSSSKIPSLFLSVCVASPLCVSASSPAWLPCIMLRVPIFRHTFVSSTSRQLYELNIFDSAHTEPLWSVGMSTGSEIGGSDHTP